MGKRLRGRGGVAVWVVIGLALSVACSLPDTDPAVTDPDYGLVGRCTRSTVPCGNGCMPESAACCDDGTRRTSNYCTNSAGGGCRPNPSRTCKAPGPSGTLDPREPSEFCCSASTSSALPEGSFDCPAGTHHCTGTSCVPIGQRCCPVGASAAECPTAGDKLNNGVTALPEPGVMCGVTAGFLAYCYPGSCCASDPTLAKKFKCLAPTGVCTGTAGNGTGTGGSSGSSGSSSGSSGGSGCRLVWDCGALMSAGAKSMCTSNYGAQSGSAAEPNKATCDMVCKSQGACTCQGC